MYMRVVVCVCVFCFFFCFFSLFFFFNDTATTEIYTLSLHDALPICKRRVRETASIHLDLNSNGIDSHKATRGLSVLEEDFIIA